MSLASAALSGCGEVPCPDVPGSIACVDGASVAVDDSDIPVAREGLADEVRRMLERSRHLWGDADLQGWTITVRGGWLACPTAEGTVWTSGCTIPATRSVTVAREHLRGCHTATLLHEYGHVAGIHDHSDARYAQAEALKDEVCPRLKR